MIDFKCPGCAKSFSVKDELAGKKTKCPKCGVPMFVPAASTPAPAPVNSQSPANTNVLASETGEAPAKGNSAKPSKAILVGCGALLGVFMLGSCVLTIGLIAWNGLAGGDPKAGGPGDPKIVKGGDPKIVGANLNVMEVTAQDIKNAYTANGIAADEKYNGKTIQIIGVIRSIAGRNEEGKAYIWVSGNSGGSEFRCSFDDNRVGELKKLAASQIVAVRGVFFRNKGLEKCEVVEVAAAKVKLELSASEFCQNCGDRDFAMAVYADKTVQITGKVVNTAADMPGPGFNRPLLVGTPDCKVRCYEGIYQEKLRQTSPGQIVTVRGTCHKDGFDGAALYSCEFVVAKRPDESAVVEKLKQIGFGIHSYHDAKKHLPDDWVTSVAHPGRKPGLGWRVAILPYIGEKSLYEQFDIKLPWDHPTNKRLISRMPTVYLRPGAGTKEAGMTHYRVLVGAETMFYPGCKATLPGITDGTSNTIMAVEATEPTIWTRPDDLPYDPKSPLPKFGVVPGGFHAVFGDATVRFIRAGTPEDRIRAYITARGGEAVPLPP